MVKRVRASMIREAGYADIAVEPRTNVERDQRRADIFMSTALRISMSTKDASLLRR